LLPPPVAAAWEAGAEEEADGDGLADWVAVVAGAGAEVAGAGVGDCVALAPVAFSSLGAVAISTSPAITTRASSEIRMPLRLTRRRRGGCGGSAGGSTGKSGPVGKFSGKMVLLPQAGARASAVSVRP
jgi:hypothetical protein